MWRKMKVMMGVGLLLASLVKAGEEQGPAVLGNFDKDMDGWTYYGGWEFKGANGSLSRAEKTGPKGAPCARLTGDFTKGGSYVAMNKTIKADLRELRFTVKSDSCRSLSLRLTDGTGQTFQYKLPFSGGPGWQEFVITNFAKADGVWGGIGDKKWHPPARAMSIMNGIVDGAPRVSELYVSGITATVKKPEPVVLEPFCATNKGAIFPAPLHLSVTTGLRDDIFSDARWEYGERDAGTADTRPKLGVARGAFNGKDALVMDVWYPNAGLEYVDYHFPDAEKCSVWAKAGYDYLAFWCKTEETEGWMEVHLNRGNWRWMNGQRSHGAPFEVKPGGWRRIVVPFSSFKGVSRGSLSGLNTLTLGYTDHRLQRPGKVLFAGFEVGAFTPAAAVQPIRLDTQPWRFQIDNKVRDGVGIEEGWYKPGFIDSAWDVMRVNRGWAEQGLNYFGVAWFRQKIMVPASWNGSPLVLKLGKPDDCGTVFFNGEKVVETTSYGPQLEAVIPPDKIRYGALNTVAVRIPNWYGNGGLEEGAYQIGPQLYRIRVVTGGACREGVAVKDWKPGVKPGANVEVLVSFPRGISDEGRLSLDYRLKSYFHRVIKQGTLPLKGVGDELVGVIALDADESRELFYSERFTMDGILTDGTGGVLLAVNEPGEQLDYDARDQAVLPPLPETWEETPYGKLKLVDAIECGVDDLLDEHPYKEGGIGESWVGFRAYSTWVKGITVNEFKGKKYREANNNEWFGYRVGRGKLVPHRAYLVRIEYPEDKTRYCPLNQDAGLNYSGKGFRTGVSADDPIDNYPLSGNYEWYDQLVMLGETGYGYKGSRTISGENGIWLFFHDNGRCYTSQYQAGPAASRIRLYEIPDVEKSYPVIRYPQGSRHRVLLMDWEREPEAPPVDAARYARFLGFNAFSPEVLKWSFTAYWPTKLGYQQQDPLIPFKPLAAGRTMNTYEDFLKAAKETGIGIMPRLEYGGSKTLPKEAYAKNPAGGNAKVGRYASWGANLLHPATWDEFAALLDETVGAYREKYPQIMGILWRMRCDRVVMSKGPKDVELYKKETGSEDLAGYEAWWHKKRLEFHLKIRDKLRSYRPDMKLYYYNWDEDGWKLGEYSNKPQDFTDYYNIERAPLRYEKVKQLHLSRKPEDYVALLKDMGGHDTPAMDLYRGVDGIAFLAPVHGRYLADNDPYINFFQTGDGLAMCGMFTYEEKGRHNVQGDHYETSEMTPGGPAYAMAEEVLACFHGDPNVITCTTYTYGRGFVNEHRRFAQAFLALPDMRGKVIEQGDADIRVRTYDSKEGIIVGVVHKGMAAKTIAVKIPGNWKTGTGVVDLVTGRPVACSIESGMLAWDVQSGPMQLSSYQVK